MERTNERKGIEKAENRIARLSHNFLSRPDKMPKIKQHYGLRASCAPDSGCNNRQGGSSEGKFIGLLLSQSAPRAQN